MSTRLRAHLSLFAANLIYGINYSVAKDVMPEYIKPFGFIFIRVSGALLLFWLFAFTSKESETIRKKDFIRLALAGLFGVAINQLLFFKGLAITTPINAAIIMTVNPILVLLIAAAVLHERISLTKVSGIALGLLGAVFLTTYTPTGFVLPDFSHQTSMGDLFVLINAISYAIYLVVVKPLMHRYKPIAVIKWIFLFGFVYVIPFGWPEFTEIDWSAITTVLALEIAFVVIGTTFFAYLLSIFALKNLNPSTVSIYIYLQPLLATLIALWWGNDHLDLPKVVAAALIFAGVYLVSMPAGKSH